MYSSRPLFSPVFF